MAAYRALASLLVCLVISGCGTFPSKGETELEFGVRAYEDGELAYAARLLQLSLDSGLRGTSNRVRVHKHLPFLHCAYGRPQQCRAAFRRVLDVGYSFELGDAETGHPT